MYTTTSTDVTLISPLHMLPLEELADRSRREAAQYCKHQSMIPQYGYELFRRAIVDSGGQAWDHIYEIYDPLMTYWVESHPAFEQTGEDCTHFVPQAWTKMWRTVSSDKFGEFSDLKSLLKYLKLCVHSVIIDHIRVQKRTSVILEQMLIPEAEMPQLQNRSSAIEEIIITHIHTDELWAEIANRLKDEREHLVIYGSFILDLKPREFETYFQDKRLHVDEVYRIKQNVLARLRRDPELKRLLM